MTTTRQDAWSQDEDLLLAEVVLRHIREGGTQLSAFEEVGKKLSRTAAACGFRWNSYVRKQHKSAIELAKKQRKAEKKQAKLDDNQGVKEEKIDNQENMSSEIKTNNERLTFDQVLSFLQEQDSALQKYEAEFKGKTDLNEKIKVLRKEKKELEKQLAEAKEKCALIEEDYKALIQIMERARKMVVLQDQETSQFSFQMDKNGNLERIDK